jgi:hypothetical protein
MYLKITSRKLCLETPLRDPYLIHGGRISCILSGLHFLKQREHQIGIANDLLTHNNILVLFRAHWHLSALCFSKKYP